MDRKFKFSAQEGDLALFVGNGTKVKIPSEIKALLGTGHFFLYISFSKIGAGKTFWATNHCKNYPAKKFNILGTNSLIDRMKVMGLRRQKNYSGRWDELIKKCSECFNVLMRIAKQRKRNYILDQTNVYPTARSRKMKDFKGYMAYSVA